MLSEEFMIPFNVAMETRKLLELKRQLCAKLNHNFLGITSMKRTMARRRLKIV